LKSQILNTHERFHIYEISKQKMQLNDTFTETCNPIYDMIPNSQPKRKATTPILALSHTPTINIPLPFPPRQRTNNNLDYTKNR
jgi:hypothetical protein